MPGFNYIELFAGIGGLGDAITWLGGRCVLAAENNDAAQAGLLARHPELPTDAVVGDVRTLTRDADGDLLDLDEVRRRLPADIQVVCGGPPCQDYSKSGAQAGRTGDRGSLTVDFLHVVAAAHPAAVVMENVPNLAGPRHRDTVADIYDTLDRLGYDVHDDDGDVLIRSPHRLAPHAGGQPQFRERVFFVATRRGTDVAEMFTTAGADLTVLADAYGFDPSGWQVDDLMEDDDQIADLDHYRMNAYQETWIDAWDALVRAIPDDRLPGELWADGFTDDLDAAIADYLTYIQERTERRNAKRQDPLPLPTEVPDHVKRKLERSQKVYFRHRDIIDRWLDVTYDQVDKTGRAGTVADFPMTRRRLEFQARSTQPTAAERNLWDCSIQLRASGIRVKPLNYLPALMAINNAPIIGPRRRQLTEREAWRLQALAVPAWSHEVVVPSVDTDPAVRATPLTATGTTWQQRSPVRLPGVDVAAAEAAIAEMVDVWARDGRVGDDVVRIARAAAGRCGLSAGELLVAAGSRADNDLRLNRPGVAHTRLLWDTYDLLASARAAEANDPALAAVDWRVLVRMQAAVGRTSGQQTTADARAYGAAHLPLALPRVDTDGGWERAASDVAAAVAAGWPTSWAISLVRSRLLSVCGDLPGQRPLAEMADLEAALVAAGLAVIDPDDPDDPWRATTDVAASGRSDDRADRGLSHLAWAGANPQALARCEELAWSRPRLWVAEVDDDTAHRNVAAAEHSLEIVIATCDDIDWDEWGTEWSYEQLSADLRVVDAHAMCVAGSPVVESMVALAAYERFRQHVHMAEDIYGWFTDEMAAVMSRWDPHLRYDEPHHLLDIAWGYVLDATDAAKAALRRIDRHEADATDHDAVPARTLEVA